MKTQKQSYLLAPIIFTCKKDISNYKKNAIYKGYISVSPFCTGIWLNIVSNKDGVAVSYKSFKSPKLMSEYFKINGEYPHFSNAEIEDLIGVVAISPLLLNALNSVDNEKIES